MEPDNPEATPTAGPRYVGIKFHDAAAVYRFDAGNLDVSRGDLVVVSTEHGNRLATVTELPQALRGETGGHVRRVVRRAEAGDFDRDDRTRLRERDAIRMCLVRVRERRIDMKLVKAEQSYEGGKIVFYFSAEDRLDFRDLARELSQVLHARVEMKQVGSRDEAKAIGAVGPCGRQLCCSTFLRAPGGVSVKMAKAQGLSLNPSKLAGMCGRLKCCLRYEYDTYIELGRTLPSVGTRVGSVKGDGVVVRQNPMKQSVLLQVDEAGTLVEAALDELVEKKKS